MTIAALQKGKTMKNDSISRQAAIDALDAEMTITGCKNAIAVKEYVMLVSDRLKRLPSVQPEQSRVKNPDLSDVEKLVASVSEEQNYDIAMEECAELIQAVSKFRRAENSKTRQNLVEELADVMICIEMVKVLANIDEGTMTDMIHHKMQRNLRRMKKGEEHD